VALGDVPRLAEDLLGPGHVAVGLGQRLLALHHGAAGPLAQLVDHRRRNRGAHAVRVLLSLVPCPSSPLATLRRSVLMNTLLRNVAKLSSYSTTAGAGLGFRGGRGRACAPAASGACGRAAFPSSTASDSLPRISSMERMLSSLPGMGRSTVSGSLSVSMQATVLTAMRCASLTAMCSRCGSTTTIASGRRFISRMPDRLRWILVNSRLRVATIFLL